MNNLPRGITELIFSDTLEFLSADEATGVRVFNQDEEFIRGDETDSSPTQSDARGAIGVETSAVSRELSIREIETARAMAHLEPLDRIIYTGMARRRLLSAARFATQSMLLRGEAMLPVGPDLLARLDIRLPLKDWPEFTEEYAERDRHAGER